MRNCKHCGGDLEPTGKVRSPEQHRRFFGLVRAAYNHWPETAEFRPESEEHLRKWLTAAAGYRDHTDIAAPYAEDEPAVTKLISLTIEASVRASGGFAFVRPHPEGGMVRVYKPKSIAFHKMGPSEFGELCDDVAAVIERETGLKADDLLREKAA